MFRGTSNGLLKGTLQGTKQGLSKGLLHGTNGGLNPAIPKKTIFIHTYKLVVDSTQCGSTNSANFTVLVSLTLTNLKTEINGGVIRNTTTFNSQTVPADLVFSLSPKLTNYISRLYWDIESYDATNGILWAWVLLPNISCTINTIFYMGIGNPSITTYQGGSVGAAWNSAYKGIWHLQNGTTLSALDASSNGFNGTITGATATTGQVDGGGTFNGSTDKITNTSGTFPTLTTAFSISAWLRPTEVGSAFTRAWFQNSNTSAGIGVGVGGISHTGQLNIYSRGIADQFLTGVTMNTINHTYYVVVTWDNTTLKGYSYDMTAATSTSGSATGYSYSSGNGNPIIGNIDVGTSNGFPGWIDQLTVANTVHSADWITAEYNNQKTSSTFITTTLVY